MVVPPPGLLSTITVWPSLSDNGPATTRAAASDAPPGGKVTISLTGRLGHAACARAVPAKARPAVIPRICLRAIIDAEAVGHRLEEGGCRHGNALSAVPVADMEDRLVGARDGRRRIEGPG